MSTSASEAAAPAEAARPLGRPPKRQDQRQRILQAAAQAIATVGYEQCSLGDIAAELDLTRQALYHYFPTKQGIFSEIAMSAMRGTYEHARAAVDDATGPSAQLEALMLAHGEHFDKEYWMVNATIAGYGGIARREIEHIREFEACRNAYRELVIGVLEEGIADGTFRDIDSVAVSRAIFQLLNITRWYRPGGAKTAVDFAAESHALIAAAIRAGAD